MFGFVWFVSCEREYIEHTSQLLSDSEVANTLAGVIDLLVVGGGATSGVANTLADVIVGGGWDLFKRENERTRTRERKTNKKLSENENENNNESERVRE